MPLTQRAATGSVTAIAAFSSEAATAYHVWAIAYRDANGSSAGRGHNVRAFARPHSAELEGQKHHALRHVVSRLTPSIVTDVPLLQRKPHCACGRGGPRCQESEGQTLQTKLKVGAHGDEYEREANRVAEQLTAAGGAFDARAAGSDAHADAATVQLKAAGGEASAHTTPDHVELRRGASQLAPGEGVPLPASARAFFETHLGIDLGSVRASIKEHSPESLCHSPRCRWLIARRSINNLTEVSYYIAFGNVRDAAGRTGASGGRTAGY